MKSSKPYELWETGIDTDWFIRSYSDREKCLRSIKRLRGKGFFPTRRVWMWDKISDKQYITE